MSDRQGEYEPLEGPEPEEWMSTSEAERHLAVEDYHHDLDEPPPNLTAHAAIHVAV